MATETMKVSSTDTIQVEVKLKAPLAKVWAALSTPEGWTGWFSEGVEGDFSVGSKLKLDFGAYGTVWAMVVENEPMKSFAYRWHRVMLDPSTNFQRKK